MTIKQLGYIAIATTDMQGWRSFSTGFLGMQIAEETRESLKIRMDERSQRLIVKSDDANSIAYLGFEVDDSEALQRLASEFASKNVKLTEGTSDELAERSVESMFWIQDPDGNRLEFFYGPQTSDEPFKGHRKTGGFKTGELGVGHAVFETPNFPAMEAFYQEILGFKLSDYMTGDVFHATFLHINPRHHSIALIAGEESRCHHIMVEYIYMDDVGRLYDMALSEENRIAVTLGRHSNDHMLSFYSWTPSGFLIETGWAGRLIDDQTWTAEALYGPSIWGHERSWLPAEKRENARRILRDVATKGVVEPTEVSDSPGFNVDGSS